MSVRDLIIVGAGPSGLSAAIAAKKRGLDYQVLEQGTLVNSIYRFPPQMVFFTTPELLDIENRIKEGSIAARFNSCVQEIRPTSIVIRSADGAAASAGSGGTEELAA